MVSENPILIVKAPILSEFCKTGFRSMSRMVDHRGGMLKSATSHSVPSTSTSGFRPVPGQGAC